MFSPPQLSTKEVSKCVSQALNEDIGSGDITAQLVSSSAIATAKITTREKAIVCGIPWVNETFKQLDPSVEILWLINEGDHVKPNQALCQIEGSARSLLTGERTALNFLQLLTGIASKCHHFASLNRSHHTKLLDTRKTLPGLRLAQKYAVRIGGCYNHRLGLHDGFLIKENHIAASGSISKAVAMAKQIASGKLIEIEVENLNELNQAILEQPDVIMLDNFSLQEIRKAVELTKGNIKLEVSGGVNENNLSEITYTNVDYVSLGTLTKDITAIDLSMRIDLLATSSYL